jgi:hypothetical protein
MSSIPSIYFYIPEQNCPSIGLPQKIDDYWQWIKTRKLKYPGVEFWTLQTYLHLKAANFPCELTGVIPDDGIVIVHRYSLPDNLQPSSKVLLVCIRADTNIHPYSQLHIVQNPNQSQSRGLSALWTSYYLPHWPQMDLIPRDLTRGDRFENIFYLGDMANLAPELRESSWNQQIESLGLRFVAVGDTAEWNNYSEVDAVLAIRSFSQQKYNHKPASKLYNAWKAGVPAILGCESAYQSERKSELDYLEATSVDDVLAALTRLRDDKELRKAIVTNGQIRIREVHPEVLLNRWNDFLLHKAVPAYYRWCKTPRWAQQAFLRSRRYLLLKADGLQRRGILNLSLD